ncbi:MAG TPA: amino acid adenylation domain-containing protein, partial [Tahibacter sp.]|nr:amino acid adenylation domain-containing protein [Tahibacter sp.]
GDVISALAVRRVYDACPNVQLINGYGPTENTTFTCCYAIPRDWDAHRPVPLGTAIRGTRTAVLGAGGVPQPFGAIGELYTSGEGLARGYHDRAELTAERFVTIAGERWYRTGDRVRRRSDGNLEFLGRGDDQVKLRGFRIEPGEIESRLRALDGVAQAVVVVRGAGETRRLVGYVVARDVDPQALRTALQQQLPDYMVPAQIVVLDALPLTANGKVDKRALPEPDVDAVSVEPATPTEAALAQLWAELLKRESVGVTANFFALGGHSLLATRLVSAIAELLHRQIAVRAVFEQPTVRALAAFIDAQGVSSHLAIPRVSRDAPLALSYAQQRLWFIDQLDGGSRQYNMPTALRLRGVLDVDALQSALDALVARHEVLRTVYAQVDGEAVQVIRPAVSVSIAVLDLTNAPAASIDEAIALEATRPFDLSNDLMLRATHVILGDEEHVLLFTMHHIASDGWSVGLAIAEFAEAYAALHAGREANRAALPAQYADYAQWQRTQLQGAALERQLGYWSKQLADAPAVHGLPLDRLRPAAQDLRGGAITQRIDRVLTDRLNTLARTNDATPFMLLQAAFAALVARWSGESDIVVGTPIAGRTHRDIEGLIGFFVNTLVLRTQVDADTTFADLLAQSRRTSLDAYAHQDVPFEMLVDRLQPERSLSHTPLFQLMFQLQNTEQSALELPGLSVSTLESGEPVAKFDLDVAIREDADGLSIAWTYAGAIFDHVAIERLAEGYAQLLAAVVEAPTMAIARLPLLSTAEQETPREPIVIDPHATLAALFEAQVARAPQAIALTGDHESLTYADLDARANRLAHHLIERGVGPDVLVGLCAPRSPAMVVAMLAIVKAGGAYVPLDPAYPRERLAMLVADSGVPLVIAPASLHERLPVDTARLVDLDETRYVDYPATAPVDRGVTTRNLAYLIYTSGSTGMPKGVQVEQRGIVRLVRDNDYLPLGSKTAFLHLSSIAFDAATLELWGPLLNGGRVVLLEDERFDLAAMNRRIVDEAVNTLWLTAGLFAQWSEAVPTGNALRHVLAGGDVISALAVRRVYDACPNVQLINGYGPTENTTFTCCYAIPRDWDAHRPVPLGTAIRGTRTAVLNASQMPQPLGAIGELYTSGEGLARGYHDRAELTAERFVTIAGERWYRTGDRVRRRNDGNLEFLGRGDDQVKLRGFRIEPGEIESRLRALDGVAQAVVVVRGTGETRRLVGYIVARDVDPQALRTALQQQLPDYMVPAQIVVLDALPLTANGKVDKRALPEPDADAVSVEPATPTESALAQLWAELLKRESVGVTANFFALGGHSLLVTRLVSAIAERLHRQIAVRAVFEQPTVRALAAHLDRLPATSRNAAVRVPRDRPLYLSPAQQRLWLIDQLEGATPQYN